MTAGRTKHTYWMYILTNQRNGTLYVGVTNSLTRRLWQHKTKAIEGFTKRHGLDRLVYCEAFHNISRAIAREKEIKGWLRTRKLALIEATNPAWRDLSADWFEARLDSSLRSEGQVVEARMVSVSAVSAPLCHESPLTSRSSCLINGRTKDEQ